ncbi:MAG TPA: hypothetical protein VM537_03105, partial [Anaerolineae bacterium]|nr:hypothetical protein [Anaerolineae bacterium]
MCCRDLQQPLTELRIVEPAVVEQHNRWPRDRCSAGHPVQHWRAGAEMVEGDIGASKVTGEKWNFVVGPGAALFERLREMPVKLGSIAHIFVGLQTSADTVFLFKQSQHQDADTIIVNSKSLGSLTELEARLLKPVVRSGSIGRFWATPTALVLIPYESVNGEAKLIPQSRMIGEYPKTWQYLAANKRLLSERERGKFRGTGWYQLYPKNLDVWEQPKILV